MAKTKSTPTIVTGLGETPEQIEALCESLKGTLAKEFKIKGKLTDPQIEAAYKFGVAERRRRKLVRKLGKSNGADD